ncbi:MAG: HAMP domain-containing sensor histidine kinase [Pseudomonadota bacterium]
MIEGFRAFVRRHWPRLRLRAILLSVLIFAAILPGVSAIFLRVYENTLVRQTEAELVAQSVALSAAAESLWPGAQPRAATEEERRHPGYYRPQPATIDLRATPVLPPRPAARPATTPTDPDATVLARRLQPIMDETSRTTLASIIVLDRNGVVVAGYGLGGDWSGLPEVQGALRGEPQTVLRRNGDYHPRYSMEWLSRASALLIHHAQPIIVDGRTRGVVLTSRSPRALFKGIYQDRGKIALGIIGTLGFIAVLALLVARGIALPIERLSQAAREVTSGGGAPPPPPATAAIEIQALYEDFGLMAEAVERRSRYLRDFAAAVSHEFKTPLAGIQGAVELLQDHGAGMKPAERRRFLDNIAADSRRLSALVTRLLDLARADMARPETGLSVDIAPAVAKAVDARSHDLRIDIDLTGAVPVSVPATTVELVLATLFENSRQAGAGAVKVSVKADEEAVVLIVADDGPGVAAGDAARIFEPFFTTRRGEGGAGLGLSIASALLAANRGTLALSLAKPGAAFEVRLPRAGEG